jgi:hypothetical protein
MLMSNPSLRALILSACFVALPACGSSVTSIAGEGDARIVADQSSYAPGESVRLTIYNVGDLTVGYMPCPVVLERLVGNDWVTADPQVANDPCDMIVHALDPGANAFLAEKALPSGLDPGTYRLRFETIVDDRFTPLPLHSRVSSSFSVG